MTGAGAGRVSGLAGGYRPGQDALRDVAFAAGPGQVVGVLGPNGGGKTTLFRALLGELPVRRGDVALAGAPAYVPQTERARLDFPVSALDVALMGAYGRTPWYRRLAQARPRGGARGARPRRARRRRRTRRSARCPAASASASCSPGRSCRTRPCCSSTSRCRASTARPPRGSRASSRELRDEGRTLLVATHDVHQAAAWDLVLCLHGRQVAFGPPAATLTPRSCARPTAPS